MSDLNQKLTDAIKKRDALRSKRDRILGSLKAAKEQRDAVRQRCLDKNIDPDKLEETIEKVNVKFSERVDEIVSQLAKLESDLASFEEKRG